MHAHTCSYHGIIRVAFTQVALLEFRQGSFITMVSDRVWKIELYQLQFNRAVQVLIRRTPATTNVPIAYRIFPFAQYASFLR